MGMVRLRTIWNRICPQDSLMGLLPSTWWQVPGIMTWVVAARRDRIARVASAARTGIASVIAAWKARARIAASLWWGGVVTVVPVPVHGRIRPPIPRVGWGLVATPVIMHGIVAGIARGWGVAWILILIQSFLR